MNPLNGPLDWIAIGEVVEGHLWQSTAFIAVCWLATLLLRKNNASIRHWIWLAASLKFLLPFFLLVGLGRYVGGLAGIQIAQPDWPVLQSISRPFEGLSLTAREPAIPIVTPRKSSFFSPWLVVAVWFAGFATSVLWGIVRWRRLAALIGNAKPLREGREVDVLRRVLSRHGGRLRVGIVSTLSAIEPGVRGIVRPVLLLPSGISDRLDDDQLETIITHELCHIRRRDNLAAAVHVIVETIFWFHPLVWWIGSRLVDERERACDEDVLKLGSDPQVYAGAILRVCEFYIATPLTTISRATGSKLKVRIEDIMTQRTIDRIGSGRKLLLSGAAIALVAAPIAFGLANAPQRPAQNRRVVQAVVPAIAIPVASGQTAIPARPVTPVSSRGARPRPPEQRLQTATPQPAVAASQGDYILGPEDELEIVVWRQPELTRRAVIRPDGKIGMPLLGDVPAAGLTPTQLNDYLQVELKRWVSEPRVTVIVTAVRSPQVTIQGAIANPGAYLLSGPLTVAQLIGRAGGLLEFAKRDQIAVIRQEATGATRYLFNYTAFYTGSDLKQDLVLKAGDIVVVP
jgi:protein involved in polysaccharide export with SLBB domain/beta-lactamase regulating signal transducer with metallopeptidase domain